MLNTNDREFLLLCFHLPHLTNLVFAHFNHMHGIFVTHHSVGWSRRTEEKPSKNENEFYAINKQTKSATFEFSILFGVEYKSCVNLNN